ncbi:GroES-like protein [Lophiostoma macrostomum CBS 122681]|uniref:GroES-like protein n=1 Tax=Lophiostoma macrostomum CBS 122681 TaxID=1314788 RepID=A0A6A6SSF2_9PLEO|nr:GroES-like protein [Lophiostoma macrostomum CBS 122681]
MAQTLAMVQQNRDGGAPTLAKKTVSRPKPASNQVLVKVSHVAQNPTDIQALDSDAFGEGTVLGCDFVGTVEELGTEATRNKKGNVIAGLIWGGEIKGLGAYSEYTLADDRISFKVPSSINFAQAATVPLACTTAWLALFSKDCLNIDRTSGKDTTVLIWGGSSSVGLYALQIAALSDFTVITTCSPRNFDLVKDNGATHVFNYSDKDVAKKIKETEPNLRYVFDTIGNSTSSATASQAISEQGGGLCTVRPGKANTRHVSKQTKVTDVLVWNAFLKEHRYGDFFWPASKDDHELSAELFDKLPTWLDEGKIKPNTPGVRKGLDAIPQGFQEYRDGKISAYKIVYEL